MVIPKGGLPSLTSFRSTDDDSTIRVMKSIRRSKEKPPKQKQHARHAERQSERQHPDQDRTGTSYGVSGTNDEILIQKLITEGLWSDSTQVVEDVLNKLGNLMFTTDEAIKTSRRDAIYRSGGHLAIVQAMKRYPKAKGVQTQGCRALANSTWETSEFMFAIAAVGGVNVILAAMTKFPSDEVVQICGCCALRNLTSLKNIAKLVVERDGLLTVAAAMRAFPGNANIQECGCWTIAHICLNKENKPYIQRERCFGPVGDAVDNHPKEPEVEKAARQAMERLWDILR